MSISVIVIVSVLSMFFFVVSLAPLLTNQPETDVPIILVGPDLNQGLCESG
jgi:hypothetical protein